MSAPFDRWSELGTGLEGGDGTEAAPRWSIASGSHAAARERADLLAQMQGWDDMVDEAGRGVFWVVLALIATPVATFVAGYMLGAM